MSDLISRQAAIEAVHKSIYDFFDICDDDEESPMTYKDELLLELNKAITTQIKAVAAAQSELEPVKHGRWIVLHGVLAGDDIYGDMGECSNCGMHLRNYEWDYCPNCGARMDEVEE